MSQRVVRSLSAVVLVIAGAAAIAAQSDGRDVLATGCLKQQRDMAAPLTNLDGKVGSDDDFVLMDVRLAAASASVPTTDPPPSDALRPANIGPENRTMFKVVGLQEAMLREHLNQQVEIKATLDPKQISDAATRQPGVALGREPASNPSASSPAVQAPPTDTTRLQTAPAVLPELRATSIKSIGGVCKGT